MQDTLHNFKSGVQGGTPPAGEENCVDCSASVSIMYFFVFSIEFILYISIHEIIINSLIDDVVHQ